MAADAQNTSTSERSPAAWAEDAADEHRLPGLSSTRSHVVVGPESLAEPQILDQNSRPRTRPIIELRGRCDSADLQAFAARLQAAGVNLVAWHFLDADQVLLLIRVPTLDEHQLQDANRLWQSP